MKIAACETYKLLSGIVCTYKPAGCSTKYLITKVKNNICNDLNNLESSTPEEYFGKETFLDKEANSEFNIFLDRGHSTTEITSNVKPSYADNVLCSGPKYQNHDFYIHVPKIIGNLTSGVLSKFCAVIVINKHYAFQRFLKKLNFTRCYQLKGILGQVTKNFHIDEKVLMKANYSHVNEEKFEKILASYQSAAYRRAFEEYGKQLHTQEAYNFAVEGLRRPNWNGPPVLYSLKLLHFEPPDFTIEVQCVNETESYLLNLIHNIGVSLKCYATCSGIRCLRQGCFHVEHALAKPQWTLIEILGNISLCRKIFHKNLNNMEHLPFVKASDPSEFSKEKLSESRDLQPNSAFKDQL